MNSPIGVGFVGTGAIGVVHAENLAERIPSARLVAISDVNTEIARQIASRLHVSAVYSDYHELLENKDVDCVAIAVPTFLKHEMILEAFKRGKHVFVEKPLALSLEHASEIAKRAEASRLKIQVGYQRRFDRAFVRAARAVEDGELGQLLMVRSWTRDPPANPQGWSLDPKLSGGIWLDTCSHDFDAVRYLSKANVVSVYAIGANLAYEQLKPYSGYDNVVISLELDNGALAEVDSCGYTVYGYDAGAQILGTRGAINVGMGEQSPAEIFKGTRLTPDAPQTFQERFRDAYRDELVDFISCIIEDKTTRVGAQDGVEAIRIGIAASESIKKKAPVNI